MIEIFPSNDFIRGTLIKAGYQAHSGVYHELEYLVRERMDGTHIVVRGTEASDLWGGMGIRDVIRDLRCIPWYSKATGWAHAGMLKGAQGLARELLDEGYITDTAHPLLLQGHSLGGGVSLLLAQILHGEWGCNVVSWLGLGTPRVHIGRREFPFETRSFRHANDIVTEIPPTWFFGYQPAVEYIKIGEITNPQPNWNDHDIDRYVELL